MNTLTPSQYEALPQDEKMYYEPVYESVHPNRIGYYTPVMIELREAETVIKELMYRYTTDDFEYDDLTEALTNLKEKAQ